MMAPMANDEKPQYARLLAEDEAQDEESIVQDAAAHNELRWRRRFYLLLVSSVLAMATVIGASIYKLKTVQSTFSCPILPTNHGGVDVPYCKSTEAGENIEVVMNHGLTFLTSAPAPVKYVNKLLVGDPDTPKFMGEPRPEMDEAWHDLLDATLIRYTEDELLQANNATSVRHVDGGYVGGLGISHSLHCLVSRFSPLYLIDETAKGRLT